MHFKTTYKDNLRTSVVHLRSGSEIETDAPVDNHGKGERFSPTDMAAAALASCMMTIMGIEAQKWGKDVTGLEAETAKIMKISPRAISRIEIKFSWPSCALSEEERNHLKEKALTCPVALSLHPDIIQDVSFGF